MPTTAAELLVLEFMASHGLALPLRPIFENLRREREISFSQRTTKRRLQELAERGYIEQLDIGNGYYVVTEAGIEAADAGQL